MSAIVQVKAAAFELLSRCATETRSERDFGRLSSGDDRQAGQCWTGSFGLCVVPWLLEMGAHGAVRTFLQRLKEAARADRPDRLPPLMVVDEKAAQHVQKADARLLPPSLREGPIVSGPVFDAPREAVSPEAAFLYALAMGKWWSYREASMYAAFDGTASSLLAGLLSRTVVPRLPLVDGILLFRALKVLTPGEAYRLRSACLETHCRMRAESPPLDSLAIALAVLNDFDDGRIASGPLQRMLTDEGLMATAHPLPTAIGGACIVHPWIAALCIAAIAKAGYDDFAAFQLEALAKVLHRERFTLGIDADGSSIAIRGDLATAACFVRAVDAVYRKKA